MLIKLVEIYRKASYTSSEGDSYSLRETYINPSHVSYMTENSGIPKTLCETSSLTGLDARQEYTTLHISAGQAGMRISVVGSLSTIQEKLHLNKREVLKG